ncbi:protein of unknown function [Micropruina glycogenica]|uniref:Uncharacterized protein n=1 Tax=Micropruina glycogenica TaxID=75385 RepID=A0A2N9JIV5_9ACTN|nr:protein of unknown function [Micropruina glycogenica]
MPGDHGAPHRVHLGYGARGEALRAEPDALSGRPVGQTHQEVTWWVMGTVPIPVHSNSTARDGDATSLSRPMTSCSYQSSGRSLVGNGNRPQYPPGTCCGG